MNPLELTLKIRLLNARIGKLELTLRTGSPAEAGRAQAELVKLTREREGLEAQQESAGATPDWRPDVTVAEDFYAL